MIASQIKEGFEYAVSEKARKGVKEEKLHTLDAYRVRVVGKGMDRWAETANDGFGGWKNDGVQVQLLDYFLGSEISGSSPLLKPVLKPRDFLMPWQEYSARRDADAIAQQKRIEEANAKEAARRKRHEAVADRLKSIEGLIVLRTEEISGMEPFHIKDNGKTFILNDTGAEFLLGRISEMVYDLLREQS